MNRRTSPCRGRQGLGTATAPASLLILLVVTGCQGDRAITDTSLSTPGEATAPLEPTVVELTESWHSQPFPEEDVDSLALGGDRRLYVTAKAGDRLWILDPVTGGTLGSVGRSGTGAGELERPNGIAASGDLLLVVERDNARVQVFSLPDLLPVLTFGQEVLRRPYGIAVAPSAEGEAALEVWVTDQYESTDGGVPPVEELDERVKHFRLRRTAEGLVAELLSSFGDSSGEGVLHKVETIAVDPERQRLLIADELDGQQALIVYGTDGGFRERAQPSLFRSEPEGIALYRCGDGAGLWVVTDQDPARTRFHLLDRDSLEELAVFSGGDTANTDGIALTDLALEGLPRGALFAVDDDARVSGFDFEAILRQTGLIDRCPPRSPSSKHGEEGALPHHDLTPEG